MFSNNLYEKRIRRRMDTCIGITGSLCCTLETNTTLNIDSKNKKFHLRFFSLFICNDNQ